MRRTLVERLKKIKQDLIEIKTTQLSQNDSYQFYAYRTDNLYPSGSGYVSYDVRFIPEQKDDENVLCSFRTYTKRDWVAVGAVDNPKEPLVFNIGVQPISGISQDSKVVYVTCISNVKGSLIVTRVL